MAEEKKTGGKAAPEDDGKTPAGKAAGAAKAAAKKSPAKKAAAKKAAAKKPPAKKAARDKRREEKAAPDPAAAEAHEATEEEAKSAPDEQAPGEQAGAEREREKREEEPSEEEFRRLVEESLEQVTVADIVLTMMNQLASMGYMKMGLPESVNLKYRDFGQARLAIDILEAMLKAAEGKVAAELLQPFRGTLANLQLNFVQLQRR